MKQFFVSAQMGHREKLQIRITPSGGGSNDVYVDLGTSDLEDLAGGF